MDACGASSSRGPTLSVVAPVYDEEDVLGAFHERLTAVLDRLGLSAEILYVDDGSRDGSMEILRKLRTRDGRVGIVALSRNFGKEVALTAGLDHAAGDAVVVIDADLQDPPELIPELIAKWREGSDVVYARRISRQGEGPLKRTTSWLFYRVLQRVSRVRIPEDTGDFRLLSRRAVEALGRLREQHRYMKGLYAWIGYDQAEVRYHRDPRHAGRTKWRYWALWNLALEGLTGFTTGPLKAATYLGLITATVSLAYGTYIVLKTLRHGDPVAGYPSLMAAVLFLGGVQLISIGIIGEYLARMFDETKRRPLYLLKAHERAVTTGPDESRRRAAGPPEH
jgi:glycosyltransferase involved in cell wall biosynthesis